ncbi:hypothetical protein WJX73_001087 [Symbiochloris irregularis]|uniref:Uncharacterized protein n=1 Tax=Symbiochloris irregularis TaxID=706552 RepID=A0AAW1PV65_9CHLO
MCAYHKQHFVLTIYTKDELRGRPQKVLTKINQGGLRVGWQLYIMKAALALVALSLLATAAAQPFAVGSGFAPLGNLRTVDSGGPYNLSLLGTQINEIKAGGAAKQDFTDRDIVDFLTNVECLEGLFDTWGTFGVGFNGDLEMGGPVPIGAQRANLSDTVRMYMEEVALNEQGHALFTRQAGGENPCPVIDFTGGFNEFLAAAYDLPEGETVESRFGAPFDPFKNDQNYLISVLTLEELGATGNKGLIGLTTNPVLANGIAGLATSATAQATVERFVLWERRNLTVEPFGETVQQVFARISALRDSLDGPQFDDQGLVNTDPRTIAVPASFINLIPTDVRGLTLNRTPQMIINILTLGSLNGTGVFFPEGLLGRINTPTGYAATVSALDDFPANPQVATQQTVAQVGFIVPPITASGPFNVTGELDLTQSLTGPLETAAAESRAAIAAKMDFTDRDIIDFLVNIECLIGLFDTWGTFGVGFNGDLEMGGPTPIGARRANLSDIERMYMQEGHVLFLRQAGAENPCPAIDFTGGFNEFMAAAYDLPEGETVESRFGAPFDPFKNDPTWALCALALEELGATVNKGLIGLVTNPVLANGIAGMATSAAAQAAVERGIVWEYRNLTVEPFNETVTQVFARISALRDSLDGPQFTDQGFVNTDPRTIAVPAYFINQIPTDVRGLTLSRTPQQIINILTLGSLNGTGVFFPEGLLGRINTPTGYAATVSALDDFPVNPQLARQQSVAEVGSIDAPITAAGPFNVTGETDLTQSLSGPLATDTADNRGLSPRPQSTTNINPSTTVTKPVSGAGRH